MATRLRRNATKAPIILNSSSDSEEEVIAKRKKPNVVDSDYEEACLAVKKERKPRAKKTTTVKEKKPVSSTSRKIATSKKGNEDVCNNYEDFKPKVEDSVENNDSKEEDPPVKKTATKRKRSIIKKEKSFKNDDTDEDDEIESIKKETESISQTSRKRAATKRKTPVKSRVKKENEDSIPQKIRVRKDILINKEDADHNTNKVDTNYDQKDGGVFSLQNAIKNNPNRKSANRFWQTWELLAELENLDNRSARNIVNLLENENTIPFICRYRRDLIRDDIGPEQLREIKNTYTNILGLEKRAETIIKQMEKEEILTLEIHDQLRCAKSEDELEFLYAPYKPASKGSLADRAKALGLDNWTEYIINGMSPPLQLERIVNYSNQDLDTVDKVFDGICHILSHNFSKSTEVLEELRRLQKVHRIALKSTKAKASSKEKTKTEDKQPTKKDPKSDEDRYQHYFDYQNYVKYLKPHQVLAINRGEKAKVLNVKIIFPDNLKNDIKFFIRKEFFSQGCHYPLRGQFFEKSFEECYIKKIQPLLTRQIRTDLSEVAKKASIEVFAKNLKQLLLMSPLKGEKILGIDPGFTNGCKLALISETADVLDKGVIYPHTKYGDQDECGERLADMLYKHGCSLIALGNGTACRETEFWITKLFEKRILDPRRVRYSIVSEQGASIYSCSEVAKKEFPNMDVNQISAVSIARRLNDPLCEYVKIEPRHIGVGMYQHDMNEKILSEALNEVVMECVSFVGVDINTASLSLLKHIAGLTASRAEKLIEYRIKNGPFKTRKDVLKVKTIGEKTFTQCAGFIRIEPLTVGGTVTNLLDCTWVHPESYETAEKIIAKCSLKLKDIGQPDFTRMISSYRMSSNLEHLEKEYKVPKERIKSVLDGLQRELFQDYRSDFDKKPLFKQGITQMSDLRKGSVVTGAVTNITHFGAFVDIGVDKDALIHSSNMNGILLNVGDRVETCVLDVDIARKRVALKLEGLSC